jgi:hypothetical protein
MNRRFNLVKNNDDVVVCIRKVFSDQKVKLALLEKFYLIPTPELARSLSIHNEFEYFYTQAGRFQHIHVDIPPKYVSFVFYIPETPLPVEQEGHNATILYDKDLQPHHLARFIGNSVCIFAPHFYSYHGFASTMARDVLVMFYVNKPELSRWTQMRADSKDDPPFVGIRDAVEDKLRRHPLIEYGPSEERLMAERAECQINAPQGRVIAAEADQQS